MPVFLKPVIKCPFADSNSSADSRSSMALRQKAADFALQLRVKQSFSSPRLPFHLATNMPIRSTKLFLIDFAPIIHR